MLKVTLLRALAILNLVIVILPMIAVAFVDWIMCKYVNMGCYFCAKHG